MKRHFTFLLLHQDRDRLKHISNSHARAVHFQIAFTLCHNTSRTSTLREKQLMTNSQSGRLPLSPTRVPRLRRRRQVLLPSSGFHPSAASKANTRRLPSSPSWPSKTLLFWVSVHFFCQLKREKNVTNEKETKNFFFDPERRCPPFLTFSFLVKKNRIKRNLPLLILMAMLLPHCKKICNF